MNPVAMPNGQRRPSCYHFGVFEADPESGELRKQGRKVRLADQSFQILLALLERPGEVVTRQQLHERLWQEGTFVDFDANLNTAMSLLRDALGESAKTPRFIETLPRRGYRLLAEVGVDGAETPPARPGRLFGRRVVVALAILAAVALGGLTYLHMRAPARAIESVAVLPLVYAGPQSEGDQEYLADGMTSALIDHLARLGVPNVISETSVMRYKDAKTPLPTIARELGADALVEGSVLREGNVVRVYAQLIDARTDRHMWARSYEREMSSFLELHDEIARAIVAEIQTRLVPSGRAERPPPRAVSPEAHEAYLKGRHALRSEVEDRRRRSVELFEAVIRLDPTFAPAYQGLADYYGFTDALPPDEALSKARRYASKALELDASLAEAHLSLAQVSMWGDWDWAAAEREFRRSLDLDPSDSTTRRWYGLFLDLMGHPGAAFAQLQRMKELDPVAPHTYHALSLHFLLARRYDEALEEARTLQELSPHDPKAFEALWGLYVCSGASGAAIGAAEQAIALWGRDPAIVSSLAIAHGRAREYDKANALLGELHGVARQRHIPPTWFAMIYMSLGEVDRAFEWLEKAFQVRDVYLVHLKVSPLFDLVRGDSRFPGLLQRMGFPEQERPSPVDH